MRFTRFVVALLTTLGLLGLPALALTAGSASAATWTPDARIEGVKRALYGREVEFLGSLRLSESDNGNPDGSATGVRLNLQRKIPGGSWRTLDTRRIDPGTGFASFTVEATRRAKYRINWDGGTIQGEFARADNSRASKLAVTRNISGKSARLGPNRFRFSGKVRPAYANKKIVLQRKASGGAWRSVETATTGAKSKYRFVVSGGSQSGDVVRYRTFTPKSKKFSKSYSRVVLKITTQRIASRSAVLSR